MRVFLSSGDWEVRGVAPFRRAAVFAAHPLPDPPVIQLRRADGGFTPWPNEEDPAYKEKRAATLRGRDHALWVLYCQESFNHDPPPNWRTSEAWVSLANLGVLPRPGLEGLKLDWIEYDVIRSSSDEATLRTAFRSVNDVTARDREEVRQFFGVLWDDIPIHDAALNLKGGRIKFNQGFAEFEAALQWGLLPMTRDEIPESNPSPLPSLLYYDLPPRLRARLEEFVEIKFLIESLQSDAIWRKSRAKGATN